MNDIDEEDELLIIAAIHCYREAGLTFDEIIKRLKMLKLQIKESKYE
jgi:DNA-binding transcriptional MerR regulator